MKIKKLTLFVIPSWYLKINLINATGVALNFVKFTKKVANFSIHVMFHSFD